MPVPVPADRRFRRAQVRPSRRRPWHRSWVKVAVLVVLLATAGAAGAGLVNIAISAEAFSVAAITVEGNERLSVGEVQTLLDGLVGQSMIALDMEEWQQRLLGSRWVETAAMRRIFPRTVVVKVQERRPVAIGQVGGVLSLFDRTGTIIDEYGPAYADLDLPIVYGLGPERAGAPATVDAGRAILASSLLSALNARPDLASRISQVDVNDVRNAMVVLKDDTVKVGLGTERFAERLQLYLDVAPVLRERVLDIDYADLRYGERVVVKSKRPDSPGRKTAGGRS